MSLRMTKCYKSIRHVCRCASNHGIVVVNAYSMARGSQVRSKNICKQEMSLKKTTAEKYMYCHRTSQIL